MPGVDILSTAFSGANAAFIAELYAKWVENPRSVDPSFAELFVSLNDEVALGADGRVRRVLGAAAVSVRRSRTPRARPRAGPRPPPPSRRSSCAPPRATACTR